MSNPTLNSAIFKLVRTELMDQIYNEGITTIEEDNIRMTKNHGFWDVQIFATLTMSKKSGFYLLVNTHYKELGTKLKKHSSKCVFFGHKLASFEQAQSIFDAVKDVYDKQELGYPTIQYTCKNKIMETK